MPGFVLILVIGAVDCAATVWAAKQLGNRAEKEIAKGIEDIVANAPAIVGKAMSDLAKGQNVPE